MREPCSTRGGTGVNTFRIIDTRKPLPTLDIARSFWDYSVRIRLPLKLDSFIFLLVSKFHFSRQYSCKWKTIATFKSTISSNGQYALNCTERPKNFTFIPFIDIPHEDQHNRPFLHIFKCYVEALTVHQSLCIAQ